MGTTSNYSWPTPEATDLVKDGWDAIKDLGDAADTTVKAVSDAQGLVHINTTSFSAVASQSINDVFSATYDNYRIVFNSIIATSDQVIYFRMRVGGVDTSGSAYYYAGNKRAVTGSGATTGLSSIVGNGTSNFYLTGTSTSDYRSAVVDINNPFLARATTYNTLGFNSADGFHVSGVLLNTTSYTSFNILPAANNITGDVSVYGYRKS